MKLCSHSPDAHTIWCPIDGAPFLFVPVPSEDYIFLGSPDWKVNSEVFDLFCFLSYGKWTSSNPVTPCFRLIPVLLEINPLTILSQEISLRPAQRVYSPDSACQPSDSQFLLPSTRELRAPAGNYRYPQPLPEATLVLIGWLSKSFRQSSYLDLCGDSLSTHWPYWFSPSVIPLHTVYSVITHLIFGAPWNHPQFCFLSSSETYITWHSVPKS